MATDKGYYSLDGALNYKTFLNHFQNQASGNGKAVLFHAANNLYKRLRNVNPMVLVDLAEQNTKQSDKPKIEVVDPNESERRRAMEEIRRSNEDPSTAHPKKPIKRKFPAASRQSSSNNKRANKGAKISKIIHSRIKRAKDIFD